MTDVPKTARTATLQVSCGVCGKLHVPERPLEFDPICTACTVDSPRARA